MTDKNEQNFQEHANLKESAPDYARTKQIPTFFGQPMLKGAFQTIELSRFATSAPELYYSHPNGELWLGDATAWLRMLKSESVDVVFADPPYNIKKAEWDIFESQEEYVAWSLQWIQEASRLLKPTGSLYICGFSEILADLKLPASRHYA